MIKNPRQGVLLPDQLPHDEVLAVARPYLGKVLSIPIDWAPVATTDDRAFGTDMNDDVWQFSNFLLEPMSSQVAAETAPQTAVGPQLLREFCDPIALMMGAVADNCANRISGVDWQLRERGFA